jgi:hypothetical protein
MRHDHEIAAVVDIDVIGQVGRGTLHEPVGFGKPFVGEKGSTIVDHDGLEGELFAQSNQGDGVVAGAANDEPASSGDYFQQIVESVVMHTPVAAFPSRFDQFASKKLIA